MGAQVLRIKQILKDNNVSRSFVWREEKAGRFPKRIKLGARAVGWLKTDLDEWLQSLKNRD
ncbi:MAG: AlpA family phage regulatory protein [Deltaproteobacteria bacterium]|nr:AlpA family phage regulatory protein [Deltaproteobacteria bacterium]